MANWLIPSRPDVYDAVAAFDEYGTITWHQNVNVHIGDMAYIYLTSPVKEIRCKCLVTDADIPVDPNPEDDGYVIDEAFCSRTYQRYMELQLVEKYDSPALGLTFLRGHGLSNLRGQRKTTPELDRYIEGVVKNIRESEQEKY